MHLRKTLNKKKEILKTCRKSSHETSPEHHRCSCADLKDNNENKNYCMMYDGMPISENPILSSVLFKNMNSYISDATSAIYRAILEIIVELSKHIVPNPQK